MYGKDLLRCALPCLVVLAALGVVAPARGQDDREPTLQEALKEGKYRIGLRYRFESVDEAGIEDEAAASTLRTTLLYETASYRGLSFLVEAENVTATNESFRNAGFGSLSNNVAGRPVVADPELTEVNQAALRFRRGGFGLGVGRYEILIGTQRFVGPVGWRQNHQSFDGASLSYDTGKTLRIDYHYIENVNRIFGDNVDMESHVVVADLDLGKKRGLQVYGLDLRYEVLSVLSTTTLGGRLTGSFAGVGEKPGLLYAVEYASQSENGRNPTSVEAGYYNLELGGRGGSLTGKVGWEVLEGAPGEGAFTTPLATLHKFNGWADKFLATPANGLEDLYLSLAGAMKSLSWTAVYHDFQAQTGDADYGSELDLQVSYRASWGQTFALKAAFYDADEHATDTDKLMFFTVYGFGN